jgi:hypothetical protein
VDFEAKNSEVFQLSFDIENVKTSTKIQKISNSRPTRTLSSRLQVSFRQSPFGVFLLGMRPISRTGHQRSLQNFLRPTRRKKKRFFYIWVKFKHHIPPSPFGVLEWV